MTLTRRACDSDSTKMTRTHHCQQLYTKLNTSKSSHPIDLKFSGKRHFHTKNIHLQFGCKRSSMLTVIAPYSTTTEPT